MCDGGVGSKKAHLRAPSENALLALDLEAENEVVDELNEGTRGRNLNKESDSFQALQHPSQNLKIWSCPSTTSAREGANSRRRNECPEDLHDGATLCDLKASVRAKQEEDVATVSMFSRDSLLTRDCQDDTPLWDKSSCFSPTG